MTKRFAVFDANSHIVESSAIWETYLEPDYRALGKFSLWREDGQYASYLKINGEAHHDRHACERP